MANNTHSAKGGSNEKANDMRFPVSCVEKHCKCHVGRLSLGCKSLLTPFLKRKETGLRHHPEDESGITGRQGKKYCENGVDFFSPHPPQSSA